MATHYATALKKCIIFFKQIAKLNIPNTIKKISEFAFILQIILPYFSKNFDLLHRLIERYSWLPNMQLLLKKCILLFFQADCKVIHPKYYKLLKEDAEYSHLGR